MMNGIMGMGLWMALWGLLGLGLIVLVILGIVWMVRELTSGRQTSDRAEEVLRHRYASGEVSQEEFRQRWTDLRGGRN